MIGVVVSGGEIGRQVRGLSLTIFNAKRKATRQGGYSVNLENWRSLDSGYWL